MADEPRPLVLFDTYERMTALDGWLRQTLPPGAAGGRDRRARRAPQARPGLVQGRLGAGDGGARAQPDGGRRRPRARARPRRRRRGARSTGLLEWAQGSPLALSLGADAARAGGWHPEYVDERPDLVQAILRRLTDPELEGGGEPEALAVAGIARVVTPRLLGDVLPGVDGAAADRWLRSLSFAEPIAGGIALHELVRKAIRADLKRRAPRARARPAPPHRRPPPRARRLGRAAADDRPRRPRPEPGAALGARGGGRDRAARRRAAAPPTSPSCTSASSAATAAAPASTTGGRRRARCSRRRPTARCSCATRRSGCAATRTR